MKCLKFCSCVRKTTAIMAAMAHRGEPLDLLLINLASHIAVHMAGGAPLSGMWS